VQEVAVRVDDQVEEQVEEEEGDARAVVQRVLFSTRKGGRGSDTYNIFQPSEALSASGLKGEDDRVFIYISNMI
jgi:hypothetical protein